MEPLWSPIRDVQPGDRVKIPRVPSWGLLRLARGHERSQITFHGVEPEAPNASVSPAATPRSSWSPDYDGKARI